MELFILIILGAIGGVAYWAYWSGHGKGYTDGLITGGKMPALGSFVELQQNPEKFVRDARYKGGRQSETPEDVARQFGRDENEMPWMEFVSRYNAALKREGREAEQIQAIPHELVATASSVVEFVKRETVDDDLFKDIERNPLSKEMLNMDPIALLEQFKDDPKNRRSS